MTNNVLVTGAAGFIGSHLAERLVHLGYRVIGLDNFDDYYSPEMKRGNVRPFEYKNEFTLIEGDIRDSALLERVFREYNIELVAHLAAKAGVRPSIQHPILYEDVNVKGTINMLETSRNHNIKRFVFASSSSVYGSNSKVPFSEDDKIVSPTSPYAASKAAGELFCRTYNDLYALPITALRLFTVYGPRQRPEMAIHLFTKMIDAGDMIPVFGNGKLKRDYTYVSDIVDGMVRALNSNDPGFEVFNLGGSNPIGLIELINLIELSLNKKAIIDNKPMQPGDMFITYADLAKAQAGLEYEPKINIEKGISLFVEWYLSNKEVAV